MRMNWDMDTTSFTLIEHFASLKSLHITHMDTDGEGAFAVAMWSQESGSFGNISIGYINEEDTLAWHHELGDAIQWNVRAMTRNDLGGVTIAAECDGETRVLCFDSEGNKTFDVALSRSPVIHLIQQRPGGGGSLWGSNRNEGKITCFQLDLKADGSFDGNLFKAVWGDMHAYAGGQVYAVVYNEASQAVALSPFALLEDMEQPNILVEAR